jgi:3-phenylpropionate/cinnamic acid dioxygenase small subunit
MNDAREAQVVRLLVHEGELLDARRWDEWLALMAPDIEYWIPAWDSESETTSDPDNEMSLIYYNSRVGLEDRVFRLKSRQSLASTPMPRTCHFVSNIRTDFQADGSCLVDANWQVHSYRHEQTTTFYGHYHYRLVAEGEGWLIHKKKIIVINALIPTVLDIHLV